MSARRRSTEDVLSLLHLWGQQLGGARAREGRRRKRGVRPAVQSASVEESDRRSEMIWMLGTAGCSTRMISDQIGLSQTRVSQIARAHARELYARVVRVRVRGPRLGDVAEAAEAALMGRLRRAGAILPRIGPVDLARWEIERQRFLSDRWWEDERFGVGSVIREDSGGEIREEIREEIQEEIGDPSGE